VKLSGATIPDAIVQRVIQRHGVEHSFADLDPVRAALVVIDLQHAFMNDAVGFAAVSAARDIVPAVNRLAAAVRETGGGVFWIKMTDNQRKSPCDCRGLDRSCRKVSDLCRNQPELA
jgi:hypothetical protein